MSFFLCFFFLLISYTNAACCLYRSKVAYTSNSTAISGGACGYGSSVTSYYGAHLAASVPSIFRDGAGCGSCFQIRCKEKKVCTKQGTRVVVTDESHHNRTDFVLSNRAFRHMAKKGMDKALLKLGVVDVEYKRVACEFKNNNFSIRVEESTKQPNYLAVKFLYIAGKTEIVAADVTQLHSNNWTLLRRNYGAVWDTSNAPNGPLEFQIGVYSGYMENWYYPQMPTDWKVGMIYDSGFQINDSPIDGCSSCDDGSWK